jgi:predicted ATPase
VRGIEELARLAPELSGLLTGPSTPAQADPDTERSLLFESLSRLLAAVSEEAPILVVIDDLHWAAKPTLLLLRHLLRTGDGTRMHVVSTYRSTDLDRTHPLSGVLADLSRDGPTERLNLTGLGSDEVIAYLAASGYHDVALGEALSVVTRAIHSSSSRFCAT